MSNWKPLLRGAAAQPAWDAIERIAQDLAAFVTDAQTLQRWRERGQSVGFAGIATGITGVALFFRYLSLSTGFREWSDRASCLLDHAIDFVATDSANPNLFLGAAGVGWTLEHFSLLDNDEPSSFPSEEIVEHLLGGIRSPWRGEFDLVFGLVGCGVLALEVRAPQGKELLRLVIEALASVSETQQPGRTWRSYLNSDREYPGGHYNLGLAHGVPGVLALLYRAARHGRRAAEIARETASWLVAQRGAQTASGSLYATVLYPGAPERDSRLAWCYGDLGVAAALEQDPERLNAALVREIFANASQRQVDSSGVEDACLCHGGAGVAHMFNWYHQASQHDWAKQSARSWCDWTLAQRGSRGFGGFLSLDENSESISNASFLRGSSGIGLALLAMVSDVEPQWQRLLLL